MVAKALFLILAVIIIGALAIIATIAVWNAVHKAMAERKLRKLNQLTQEMEDRL